MCIFDRKIVLYSSGRRETVETITRCQRARAPGGRLCTNVLRLDDQSPVEATSPVARNTPENTIITEGKDGRRHVYRDISNRSSTSSSVRRSYTLSERSSVSSASSPISPEPRTAPTMPPPPAEPMSPSLKRIRTPYPPYPPPPPNVVITADGTAQYSRPPSLYMSRAAEPEPPSTLVGERTLPRSSSWSSTKVEIDDPDCDPLQPKRRVSTKLETDTRPPPSYPSSPAISSPGLSNLPTTGHFRKDSAADIPTIETGKRTHYPSDSERHRHSGRECRRRDEINDAETTYGRRRPSTLEDQSRRRRDEGNQPTRRREGPEPPFPYPLNENVPSERPSRETRSRPALDPLRRDADALRAERARIREKPMVHQYAPPRPVSWEERGAEVLAREQARGLRDGKGLEEDFRELDVGCWEEVAEGGKWYYPDERRRFWP